MQGYTDLIKALRSASTVSTAWEKLMRDAADAIEALQVEQKKTVTQIFGEEQQEWEEYCTGLMNRIKELKAQLPKRGEWVKNEERYGWHCSCCKVDNRYAYSWNSETMKNEIQDNYCPNCGARMEVQE